MLILAHSLCRFIWQSCVGVNTGHSLFVRVVWMLILAHSLFRFIWQSCVDVNTGTLSISVYLAEMC